MVLLRVEHQNVYNDPAVLPVVSRAVEEKFVRICTSNWPNLAAMQRVLVMVSGRNLVKESVQSHLLGHFSAVLHGCNGLCEVKFQKMRMRVEAHLTGAGGEVVADVR